MLQAALTALWRDEGVEPVAVVGHSSGEVAAAYTAGVLTLQDALRVSYCLGRLHARRVSKGTMLAVGLNGEQARRAIASVADRVCVAAVNGPSNVTLAGEAGALEAIASQLRAENVFNRFLHVDVPYHSHHMEPLQAELRESLKDLRVSAPALPLYSTVTGRLTQGQSCNADYWCANIRETVQFEKAVGNLIDDGYRSFLEIGPHPVLSSAISECLTQRRTKGLVLASLRRGQPERAAFSATRAILRGMGATPSVRRSSASEHARMPAELSRYMPAI